MPGTPCEHTTPVDGCPGCEGMSRTHVRAGEAGGSTTGLSPGAPAPLAQLAKGEHVGRYVVVRELGHGGMGVVYQAYDPELDRKLALKLLGVRPGSSGTEHADRLRREGQALARVSHPNVVPVYDVGAHAGAIFIAMEFVDGANLGDWARDTKPGWRQVVATMREAGKGLAAAHAAGLVHRDFKPANVLVGKDGRVRVADFGLVRAVDAGAEPAQPVRTSSAVENPVVSLRTPLTQMGAFLGTPAYMAPEQFAGKAGDARSDQFSFCASLYELLYGPRPFAGETVERLREAVLAGRVSPAPPGTRVPGRVHAVVLRGLALRPEDRFPSMDALDAALGQEPARRWRYLAGGVAAAAALAGAVGATAWFAGSPARACRNAPAARWKGVWDGDVRQALRQRATSPETGIGLPAWQTLDTLLDERVRDWSASYVDACEATRVRHEQPEDVLSLRMACLDRWRLEASAFVQQLRGADRVVLGKAAAAVDLLHVPAACADVEALRGILPPPQTPEGRAAVAELEATLASARALLDLGQYPGGIALAKPLVTKARDLGWSPLLARADLALGELEVKAGEVKGGAATLEEAVAAADKGRDDESRAEAWMRLGWADGVFLGNAEKALEDLVNADAVASRLPENQAREASATWVKANVLIQLARLPEALVAAQRVVELSTRVYGAEHPETTEARQTLGQVLDMLGRKEEARTQLEGALSAVERRVGPDSPLLLVPLNNLGLVVEDFDDWGKAAELFERAAKVTAQNYGDDSPNLASPLTNLAEAQQRLGRTKDAMATLSRALALDEKALGPDHPDVGRGLAMMGKFHVESGDAVGGLAPCQRALAIEEKTIGPKHPDLFVPLWCLARSEREQGHPAQALPYAERALDITSHAESPDESVAQARFLVAQLTWDVRKDARASRKAAEQARAEFEKYEKPKEVAEVDAWLAHHPGKD